MMRVSTGIRAAGRSDPGLQRENNEDRFHEDAARGLFMVVDGVGGHAAGEKAAEIAVSMLRARLERETGAVEDRVREAITVANNEVRRVASLKEEWRGMGCVLTVAVLDGADAVVGHVGDTRLYKIRGGRIQKITRDHSPVGEREDAGELSEAEAMQHPRRNEVFRDVGSAERQAFDEGFIDITRVPFESDAALLLCTDGLTDLVTSGAILDIVQQHAGRPDDVAAGLIAAANAAGGKDNVTVVYAEGPRFLTGVDTGPLAAAKSASPAAPSGVPAARPHPLPPLPSSPGVSSSGVSPAWRTLALALLLAAAALAGYLYWSGWRPASVVPFANAPAAPLAVRPGESIAAAIADAPAGADILVEPGEYRERLVITKPVRLWTREGRTVVLRLPAGSAESDTALAVTGGADIALTGFRIIGDAATPLGTGISVTNARVRLDDVEITGASGAALDFGADGVGWVVAASLHDNAGPAVRVRAGASPSIVHSVFQRNGTAPAGSGIVVIEPGSRATFADNVFAGTRAESLPGVNPRTNWFPADAAARPPAPRRPPR